MHSCFWYLQHIYFFWLAVKREKFTSRIDELENKKCTGIYVQLPDFYFYFIRIVQNGLGFGKYFLMRHFFFACFENRISKMKTDSL